MAALLDDFPFDQLDPIILAQETGAPHSLVFLDGEAPLGGRGDPNPATIPYLARSDLSPAMALDHLRPR